GGRAGGAGRTRTAASPRAARGRARPAPRAGCFSVSRRRAGSPRRARRRQRSSLISAWRGGTGPGATGEDAGPQRYDEGPTTERGRKARAPAPPAGTGVSPLGIRNDVTARGRPARRRAPPATPPLPPPPRTRTSARCAGFADRTGRTPRTPPAGRA